MPEAEVGIFTPPPVSGLGSSSGFKIIIEDRNSLGLPAIQKAVEDLIATRLLTGIAVLWVTHDAGQARRIARRQLVVEAGSVREEIGQWPVT